MTRTKFDILQTTGIFQATGTLGRCVGSYRKTFKRKKGEGPWKQVVISGYPEVRVSISFDGRTYHNPITIKAPRRLDNKEDYILDVAARGVRIEATRSTQRAIYSIMCRE